MEQLFSADIVLFGLGNVIRSDDGLGIHAFQRLRNHPRVPADVALYDGGTLGLELACYASQASRILLLDAVETGERPGTLIEMANSDLWGLPGGKSVHQLGLADLLSTLSLVSETPKEIMLMGIQPGTTDWGTTLSPAVEAAMPLLLTRSIELLLRWVAAGAPAIDQTSTTIIAQPLLDRPGTTINPRRT